MVKQYRKKPVVVDALLWDGENHRQMFDFLTGTTDEPIVTSGKNFVIEHNCVHGGLVIRTLEGAMYANIGDYIIRGVKGEFYPCKPDIFEATYDHMITEE